MIIYNVTVKIEEDAREEWQDWMKKTHIPDVMKTGLFKEASLRKIYIDHEDGDTTFSIQYKCSSINDLEDYQNKHATRLQEEHTKRYQGKYVAFRTVMEEMDSF